MGLAQFYNLFCDCDFELNLSVLCCLAHNLKPLLPLINIHKTILTDMAKLLALNIFSCMTCNVLTGSF